MIQIRNETFRGRKFFISKQKNHFVSLPLLNFPPLFSSIEIEKTNQVKNPVRVTVNQNFLNLLFKWVDISFNSWFKVTPEFKLKEGNGNI